MQQCRRRERARSPRFVGRLVGENMPLYFRCGLAPALIGIGHPEWPMPHPLPFRGWGLSGARHALPSSPAADPLPAGGEGQAKVGAGVQARSARSLSPLLTTPAPRVASGRREVSAARCGKSWCKHGFCPPLKPHSQAWGQEPTVPLIPTPSPSSPRVRRARCAAAGWCRCIALLPAREQGEQVAASDSGAERRGVAAPYATISRPGYSLRVVKERG
jgi:hypothetical protein